MPALVTLLLAGTAGCDTSIQPFADETGLYSVYGRLTLSDGPHYVRVRNLNTPSPVDAPPPLDATVTLENLTTGTTETLTDSVVLIDSTYTHNFRADQPIQPEATYRLTVERSDGQSVQATATMPPRTDVDVEPAGSVACDEAVRLYFRNVPEARLLRLSIGVRWGQELRWVDRDIETSHGFRAMNIAEQVIPDRELRTYPTLAPEEYCTLLDDKRVRLAYTHLGPDWPADSTRGKPFASNVENGLGRFGGLHRDTLIKPLDVTLR
jgi:hypothetical protein